ncbi:MAG: ammonia-dependent NAD(+) synthetase [Candidatus Saccharimonadales bacterium]|jgi:NAD+ synthase
MTERQSAIIAELGVQPSIEPLHEFERRVDFLAAYLAHTGLRGFTLGISGGQDSLLAGLIAQRAVELRRRQGFDAEFHAILLPYGIQADRADAELAITTIAPDAVHDIDIKPTVDALRASYSTALGEPLPDPDGGNVKARARMTVQYAVAGHRRLLVIGTDHAAEAVTGFFTKFGDGGADVIPLSGLTKRQGRAILRALNVPELFTTKPPTADLLDKKPGQTDEDELGLTYDQLDDYLEGRSVDPDIAAQIEARYDSTWHKRSLPVAYRRS